MTLLIRSFRALSLALLFCGSLQAQARRAPASIAAAPSMPDTSALIEALRRSEYRFHPVGGEGGVWSAPSRGQELRSRVSAAGLEVFPRATSADGVGAPWKLALTTTSFGRVDGSFPLPRANVNVADERVELDHGYLVEWFVNEERGIEQGWTIAERPIGSEAISIGLTLAGDLSLRIEEGARSGVFVDACGEPVLRYRDLLVLDANGREISARLVAVPAGVAIEVDDAGAVYPLTVDPLLTGPAWTATSTQPGALFGFSVSSAGDVNGDGHSDALVGAPGYDNGQTDEGQAYVFHGSSTGLSANPSWIAEINEAGARFGDVAATAGDVNGDGYSDVIVAARASTAVYVYHGSPVGLAGSPAWSVDPNDTSAFGNSVSTAGDVNGDGYSDVIIGAPSYANGQSAEGRAVVYMGSASGLSASIAWSAESNQANASFGGSVCTAGDVNGDGYADVIVGAIGQERAYVYHGSAAGLVTAASWTANAVQASSAFAYAVSTAGDVNGDHYSDVIVGARFHTNGETSEGRVFVYHGSASGLSGVPVWGAESNQSNSNYGYSVSTGGDFNGDGYSDVIIGALTYDGGQAAEGRAYAYQGSATGLAAAPVWTAEIDQMDAVFGNSVATAGDVNGDGYADVLVGARGFGSSDVGRAYAYHGSPSGLAATPHWGGESNQAGALYGISVSSAGDVNGDGYSDVVVGAYGFDNGQTDEGSAFLYLGSADGPPSTPAWTGESDQAFAHFGISVSSAGDVNGDGYSDVIVGASDHDGGESDEGRAYVYHGYAGGLAASPAWTAEANQTSARLGFSVSGAGDVDADGYAEVIVGAYAYDGGESDEGRAFVYRGSPTGLGASPSWTAESNQANAHFGISVSSAGDVNGDGRADVVVGAYDFDGGETDEGRAYVFHGSAGGLGASPAWTGEPNQSSASFGNAVASAGDVNGDGYSDVIVGAYRYDGDQVDEGRAYVYHGSPTGLGAGPAWTAESNQASAYFGFAVSSAGDVNSDASSDVLVGAIWYDNGETDEGRAFAYLGSASGLAASPAWTVESNQASALLGNSVACAGDVNGDGYSDVIVGDPYFDGGEADEGRIRMWFGNDGSGGLVRVLQQRTGNGARPLSVVGLTGEHGLFRIRCEFAKNPVGTSWASAATPMAHLEWEVKPLGVPFDGTGIQRGAEQSLLPTGGTLTFDELASIDDAVGHARTTKARSYHWRARVATNSPLFPSTAWFGVQGSNVSEAKLRKPALEFP